MQLTTSERSETPGRLFLVRATLESSWTSRSCTSNRTHDRQSIQCGTESCNNLSWIRHDFVKQKLKGSRSQKDLGTDRQGNLDPLSGPLGWAGDRAWMTRCLPADRPGYPLVSAAEARAACTLSHGLRIAQVLLVAVQVAMGKLFDRKAIRDTSM